MSDPVRWRDPKGDGPAAIRELLSEARSQRAMPPGARARLTEHAARIAAGGSAAASSLAFKGVAASAVGVASILVIVALTAVSRTQPATRGASVQSPATSARALPEPLQTHTPPARPAVVELRPLPEPAAATQSPRPPLAADAHRSAASPAGAATHASREFGLVSEATQALGARNPALALRRSQEAAREYPRGDYIEERERVAIFALHAMHHDAAARARANAYLTRFPRGIYAGPVRRMLEASP